ncbi:signal peptide peptidase SppA, partial [Bdellovibrionota bacterium FG-2]
LEQFEESDEIKAVVLRLNSPGGAVAPSQEIYEAVKAYKKPIIASMSSVAASGAFYVACGAQRVFANPGTITGSIGVIMEFINLEKLYEWAKVQRYSIKTGVFKDAGAEYREMTAPERALLQAMVDDVLTQFKQAIVTGRKLPAAEVDAIADGRIFSGAQAKAVKLVDELGTLHDAIAEAGKLGKIKGKPRVVYPEKKRSRLLSMLLDDHDSADEESSSNFGGMGGSLGNSIAGIVKGAVPPRDAQGVTPGIYWLWNPAR